MSGRKQSLNSAVSNIYESSYMGSQVKTAKKECHWLGLWLWSTSWLSYLARTSFKMLCLLFILPFLFSDLLLGRNATDLNCEFNSGAPPVMSRVLMQQLGCLKSSMQRSAVDLSIISVRLGELSTWQCEQAWLQYSPIFSWRIEADSRLRRLVLRSCRRLPNMSTLDM